MMGHGDEIVLGDANFPSASIAADGVASELLHCDGVPIPQLLEAILELMPLDAHARPATVMAVSQQDEDTIKVPEVWQEYQTIIEESETRTIAFEELERFQFYERAKKAFAVVRTGETSMYGNIILKKGCLVEFVFA